MFKTKLFSKFLANRFFSAKLAGAVFSTLVFSANAACDFSTPPNDVKISSLPASSLKMSEVNGYKLMGTRDVMLNVICSTDQTAFKMHISGISPVAGNLVRWGSEGALKFQAKGAKVGGIPVNLKLQSSPGSPYSEQVDLAANDAVVLDLSSIPAGSRKSFSVQIHLIGLLPENYRVISRMELSSVFQARAEGS